MSDRADELAIAVDAMGGDHAPDAIVEGAIQAARQGIRSLVVGPEERLRPMVADQPLVEVVHAPDVIGMGDDAVAAARGNGSTSVHVTLRLVRDGKAAAAVSCGNTGALVVAAHFDLGLLPGVERSPIATVLPRANGGKLILLDAGATVDCRPETLVTYARLGASYAEAIGMDNPRVGLLANGEEDTKGNAQTRATLPLLRQTDLNVVGNVEPSAAMDGACEVLVTDGFVGNVILKAVEGAASVVTGRLRKEIHRRWSARFGAWMLGGAMRRFRQRVDWDAHGGAVLLGTQGVVVVGHGRANASAVRSSIHLAHRTARSGSMASMAAQISQTPDDR